MSLPCKNKGCAYCEGIPGSAHVKCVFDWIDPNQIPQNQSKSARTAQWFMFPLNYDPVWGPDACPGFSKERDPKKVKTFDPLTILASLLR